MNCAKKKKRKQENARSKEEVEAEEVQKEIGLGPPVDYSYKKIRSLKDFNNEHPRSERVRRAPERGPNNRFLSRSLWLSNNTLIDLDGFGDFMNKVFEQPSSLAWLDLSSNYLNNIPKEIAEFTNLQILYMQNNIIEHLVYVKRLVPLKKLSTLTLYGNPIEDNYYYKSYILYFFPELKSLDRVRILPSERKLPMPPRAVLDEQEPEPFSGTVEDMVEFIKT